ncbi:MAG: hypothetical protein HY909_00100 [Deltaproteobacteria bacterium]|nr:hypothetical protein [Deltaproteobacteria bacterium]
MAKAQSPLLGYNNNVRHKGRVFHIQTEDSGIGRPHVITHLFADGGRILKSQKTSYADKLDAPDVAAVVKKLMQEQHKAMFIALRDGTFDAMLEVPGAPPETAAAVPGAVTSEATSATGQEPVESAEAAETPAAPGPPAHLDGPVAPTEPAPLVPSILPPEPEVALPTALGAAEPLPDLGPLEFDLDVAVAVAAVPPSVLPKGPSERPALRSSRPLTPVSVTLRAGSRTPVALVAMPPPARRNAQTPVHLALRPPVVAPPPPGHAPPVLAPMNIFGEAQVTERSLDEVILAYLAEELKDAPQE